ncbi:hypothetical protein M0D69_22520 [Caballeronia sp. SEWSISQ10-4 2]|uniref:hypothetical protein n=1 Tax=Caballeronia sp. SEWSISQ10-4 2 TaxID=2937438 RepID=UPI002651E6BC|nr:hypothetical protein [Caballeronia sp. SEWSISQ10-4 2]MDN7180721.1 hypothetical protein [Caballeronia sp. SEWSISQ10-4 2]
MSAGLNPLVSSATNGQLSPAAMTAISMIASGTVAGALGYDVQGAMTAAENETLNNFCDHNSCGKALSAFAANVLKGIDNAMNAGAGVPAMDSSTNLDLLKGVGNTALNAATFSFPGSDSFTRYFSYSNQTIGGIGELYGLGGLGELATSSLSSTTSTPISDTVLAAQQRQAAMLDANTGFNVSPTSWDSYASIGRNGTYITDQQAITGIPGSLNLGGETSITSSQAAQVEQAMGLQPGSLAMGLKCVKWTESQAYLLKVHWKETSTSKAAVSISLGEGRKWLLSQSRPQIRGTLKQLLRLK